MNSRNTNSFHLLIARAPKKAIQQFIILFYVFVQFILPAAFLSNISLLWLTFFLALPVTIVLVFVLRNIRLASQRNSDIASFSSHQGNALLLQREVTKDTPTGLSWQEFEKFVAETYRRGGYRVEQKGGRNPDGGIDLVLHSNDGRMLVQCKHWKT